MSLSVLAARLDFLEHARPSVAYCRQHNIDWIETEGATGGLFLAGIELVPPAWFNFAQSGIEAAVIEALAEDAETVTDLVAWPTVDPGRMLTMLGPVPMLGTAKALNPATYFQGRPLRLFRRPLEWLKAQCDGAVILDPRRAAFALNEVSGRLAAEDLAHAEEIKAAMLATVDVTRILAPRVAA